MKFIRYFLILLAYMPIFAMNTSSDSISVTLAAPEYWVERDGQFMQCDLDEGGQPGELRSREGLLESEYVNSFPKLQHYLAKNNNRLKGFDPKQFNLLKDCLQLSYIYKNTEQSNEKKRIKDEIKILFDNPEHLPRKLIDALYISRIAGLGLIEKLAVKAFEKRTISRLVKEGEVEVEKSRPIAVDDIYPSYDSLDEIGQNKIQNSEGFESDEEVQSSFSFVASWYSRFRNLFATKPCTDLFVRPQLSPAELAEITQNFRPRQTAFYHVIERIKREKEWQYQKEQKQRYIKVSLSWWERFKFIATYLFYK